MTHQPADRPPERPAKSLLRKSAPILLALALAEIGAVAGIYFVERSTLKRDMFKSYNVGGSLTDRYEILIPGIRQPAVREAGKGRLSDSEEVIGIEVRGQARAYRLAAMKGREQHVVNDLVGDVPVSVTYCDLTDCVRAFTDRQASAPLDIWQGGLKGNHMVLTIQGVSYIQDTGETLNSGPVEKPIPYESMRATRTTWKAWKTAHPGTELYDGADPG